MTFDYTRKGQVMIHMYQYIEEILAIVPMRYREGVGNAIPAPNNLYEVRNKEVEEVEMLTQEEKEDYHTLTAQLLYLSKRARSDLQMSVAWSESSAPTRHRFVWTA